MPVRTAADRGREVRLRLLGAAAELITELGWTGVSTRILAERAGVTPGLVHYHFPSLQALLRDAALGMISDLLSGIESIFDDDPGLDRGVEMLLGSLDAYTGSDRTSLLFTETYLAAIRDEALRIELIVLVDDFRRKLARWLSEQGANRPEDTAAVLAAAIDGVMLHRMLDPRLTSSAVTPVLRRLITSGVAAHENSRKELR
ncbi:MAG: TetR/AcrR family transcriptional regulator [Actinomycetota bacterium]|nr:TetR/AcrR family transcriptional regulator [Actinomycetota bacterium]